MSKLKPKVRAQSAPASAVVAAAAPAGADPAAALAGRAGSPAALDRLNAAMGELKAMAAAPVLRQALAALKREDAVKGGELALQALKIDERSGFGWYLLAISRERLGDFATAVQAYESALALTPDHAEIANDLGRLAYRLGMKDTAGKLFAHYLAAKPGDPEGANNLACVLRDQNRFAEAIDILKPALERDGTQAILWNTLGTVLTEQGDSATALTFFEEALRLQPRFNKAAYNRGNALLAVGRPQEALDACEAAMALTRAPDERAMMRLASSTHLLCLGRIGEGWDAYEARLDPNFADVTTFQLPGARWTPEQDLAGRRLLVCGEQGLGDEVLFANLLPDVVEALGPEGQLILALEPRLVPLFQRTYPAAIVGAHETYSVEGRSVRIARFAGAETAELHAPIGSLLRRFRRSVDSYPDRRAFLTPDPARVAHWRAELSRQAGDGFKLGLLWKSLKHDGGRSRQYAPFSDYSAILTTPGVTVIDLQYGVTEAETAWAAEHLGVRMVRPEGIDLMRDLDDLAALTGALDLTVGPANATSNIAAACGSESWMTSAPGAWTRLGTDRFPWYPAARAFIAPTFAEWHVALTNLAAALPARVAQRG